MGVLFCDVLMHFIKHDLDELNKTELKIDLININVGCIMFERKCFIIIANIIQKGVL